MRAQLEHSGGAGDHDGPAGGGEWAEVRARPAEQTLRAYLCQAPALRALVRTTEWLLLARAGGLPAPVLDVGCGDGLFAELAFAAPLAAGIDPDLAAIRQARSRATYRVPALASATRMPFRDGYFASVIANCSLEHIRELDLALAEIRRVLRPGGRFAFGVPSHAFGDLLLGSTVLRAVGLRRLGRGYGDWFNWHSAHFTTDDPASWERRLVRHGFAVRWWQYYVSPAAHRVFDLCHYLGVPRLLWYQLTGRWVVRREPVTTGLWLRWLLPLVTEETPELGGYVFFDACKRARPG